MVQLLCMNLLPCLLSLGQCPGNSAQYFAEFYNAAQDPVDIFWINYKGKEVKYKSCLDQGDKYRQTTYFSHQWIFKDSSDSHSLFANANGMKENIFEGCAFKAEANSIIHVTITEGN